MSHTHNLDRLSAPVYKGKSTTTTRPQTPSQQKAIDRVSVPNSDYSRTSGTPSLGRTSLQRASAELASRTTYHSDLILSITLKDIITGKSVYYKFDGSRFEHTDATIKVMSNALYKCSFRLKPILKISDDVVFLLSNTPGGGSRQSLINLSGDPKDHKSLTGEWKCELPSNVKGERTTVWMNGKITDFGEFNVPIMFKVYPFNNKAALNGFQLKETVYELNTSGSSPNEVARLKSVRYMS